MYKFARLRALLWSLAVRAPSRRKTLARWAFMSLGGGAVTVCFTLALIFRTPHDWPVAWSDIATGDEQARSFLLSSFVSLMSGLYFVSALTFGYRASTARLLPLPAVAPALRAALRARDPRIVRVEQIERPAHEHGSEGASAPPVSTLTVPSPEPLTRPLWLALAMFAAAMLALAFTAYFLWAGLWVGLSMFDGPSGGDSAPGASRVFTMLRFAGMVAPLALVALGSAWRLWIGWRARVRGALVELNAEGLAIQDQMTGWRRRFILWGDVVSLARFTYNDVYVRARTVYLLDAGDQTFLWESPPDARYATAGRRARIAASQARAAELLARVSEATGQPLLDITSVVGAVTKIEPQPHATCNEPDARDVALLEFIEGGASRCGASRSSAS